MGRSPQAGGRSRGGTSKRRGGGSRCGLASFQTNVRRVESMDSFSNCRRYSPSSRTRRSPRRAQRGPAPGPGWAQQSAPAWPDSGARTRGPGCGLRGASRFTGTQEPCKGAARMVPNLQRGKQAGGKCKRPPRFLQPGNGLQSGGLPPSKEAVPAPAEACPREPLQSVCVRGAGGPQLFTAPAGSADGCGSAGSKFQTRSSRIFWQNPAREH